MWAGVGAWCLSSSGGEPHISANPDASSGNQDRHQAPSSTHPHPLSLQNAGRSHSPMWSANFIWRLLGSDHQLLRRSSSLKHWGTSKAMAEHRSGAMRGLSAWRILWVNPSTVITLRPRHGMQMRIEETAAGPGGYARLSDQPGAKTRQPLYRLDGRA